MRPGIELVPEGWIERLKRLVKLGYYPSVDRALRIGLLMVGEEDTILFDRDVEPDRRVYLGRLDNESIVEKLMETYERKSFQDIKKSNNSKFHVMRQDIYISVAKEAVLRKEEFMADREEEATKSVYDVISESRV